MTVALRVLAACAVVLLACDDPTVGADGPVESGRIEVSVAPLTLPGITDACYGLTIFNGDDPAFADVVTEQTACADRFGDGQGSISYVAPCDADGAGGQRPAAVQLVLEDLCAGGACDPAGPGANSLPAEAYANPCPAPDGCVLPATCAVNADTAVTFSLAILRPANQGFFDIAVAFDDVFCSAKFDCRDAAGDPLLLLHGPDGQRAQTAVLAMACTGGGAADTTQLYMSNVDITCGAATSFIDPSAGPGNLPASAISGDAGGVVTGAATYRGVEQLGYAKRYWNLAIGLDLAAAASGGPSLGPAMDLISRSATGSDVYSDSIVTPDGRWVAFDTSDALLPVDTDGAIDVYVYDRLTDTLEMATVDSAGLNDTENCVGPDISDDGQRVIFWCNDNGLTAGDTNGAPDVFLRDRATGVTQRISDAAAGGPSSGGGGTAFISGDGAFVAYFAFSADQIAGGPVAQQYLLRHEVANGARVWIDTAPGSTHVQIGSEETIGINYDGDVIAFVTQQVGLVAGDTNGERDVFVRVVSTGVIERVSVSTAGAQATGRSYGPSISGDGTLVGFSSEAPDLVAADTNGQRDVFVHDRVTGTTTRVSVTAGGAQANGSHPVGVSDNGAYVVFSTVSALDPADANGTIDLYRYELATGAVVLVTATTTGTGAGFTTGYVPRITTGNTGQVAFTSFSGELVSPPLTPASARGVWVFDEAGAAPAGGPCALTATATASEGPLAGGAIPAGSVYPYIAWNVPLTAADGALACGRHAVNDGGGQVQTSYTSAGAPLSFAHCSASAPCP